MAHSSDFHNGEDGYVDIHGNDIRVFVCEQSGQILVPISELKNKGFTIYRKNQYNRLLMKDSQFFHEFDMYLLQSAQNYMLKQQLHFKENVILESIDKAKKRLSEGSTGIEYGFSEDISITREMQKEPQNSSTLRSPHSPKNNSPDFQKARTSPDQMSNSPDFQNARTSPDKMSNSFDFQKPRTSNDHMSNSSDFQRARTSPDKMSSSFDFQKARTSPDKMSSSPDFQKTRSSPDKVSNSSDFQKPKSSPDQTSENWSDRSRDSLENKKRVNFEGQTFDAQGPRNDSNQIHQKRRFTDEKDNKIVTLELNKPEHNVIVVNCEQPGLMWVQDEDNADIVSSIIKRASEEAENQKNVTKYEMGDLQFGKVYLALHDNYWYRAKLIKFKPLTVLFLDYGNTAEVNVSDLREISDELASIPAQAIRVFYNENQYTAQENDELTIRVKKKSGKCSFKVDVLKKVDETRTPAQNHIAEPAKIHSSTVTIPTYFDKPKSSWGPLQNGQKVMIINEVDGKIALRTKESHCKLSQIENTIKDVILQEVGPVKKNQLILCNKDDKLFRGQVIQVRGTMVEVELIDYCEKVQVDVSEIKQINEALCLEPPTYLMSPTIKGLKELTDKGRSYIKKLIDSQPKASVIVEGDDFDLELSEGRLSDMLL